MNHSDQGPHSADGNQQPGAGLGMAYNAAAALSPPPNFHPQQPLAYNQPQQFPSQLQQQQQLQAFWANQMVEVEHTADFKNHSLPLARIKKIMKADEDVRMISAEAPAIFSKACEMFILELTLRSWIHTEENKRRTLQKSDIEAAISRTDLFDFLVDIVPREDFKEDGGPFAPPAMDPPLPYYPAPPPPLYHQQPPFPFMQWPPPPHHIQHLQQQQQPPEQQSSDS